MPDCELQREVAIPSPSMWDRIQNEIDFPLAVLISLTGRCPLSCGHCYIPQEVKPERLGTAELLHLLDELVAGGTLRVTFTGGEPAVRSDLVALVAAAAKRRFAVGLKTSAFLFDEKRIETLWNAGLSEMNVSLYHPEAAEHDRFVGAEGAFARAVGALRMFQALGGRVRASIVAMDWNTAAIPRLLDFCEGVGLSYGVDIRVTRRLDGTAEPFRHRASGSMLAMLLDDQRITRHKPFPRPATADICDARHGCYVNPDGAIWPCPNLPLLLGNIFERPFAEIWRDSEGRRRLKELRWGDSERCRDCQMAESCERCPGEAWLEHGNLNEPATTDCELARVYSAKR
ncbi:MAG: radical SAM protein [Deltaproteobacteria bacterium]|nr:radical SAM protein [Deltaproteobacteria bacterium]